MILKPSPISADRFFYHAAERTFCADLSDLGHGFNFGQVYDDACDVGLTLVSPRTGKEIVFAISGEKKRDGELLWIDLVPADFTDKRFTVRLFND